MKVRYDLIFLQKEQTSKDSSKQTEYFSVQKKQCCWLDNFFFKTEVGYSTEKVVRKLSIQIYLLKYPIAIILELIGTNRLNFVNPIKTIELQFLTEYAKDDNILGSWMGVWLLCIELIICNWLTSNLRWKPDDWNKEDRNMWFSHTICIFTGDASTRQESIYVG